MWYNINVNKEGLEMEKWKIVKGFNEVVDGHDTRSFETLGVFDSFEKGKKEIDKMFKGLEKDFDVKRRGDFMAQMWKDGKVAFTLSLREKR